MNDRPFWLTWLAFMAVMLLARASVADWRDVNMAQVTNTPPFQVEEEIVLRLMCMLLHQGLDAQVPQEIGRGHIEVSSDGYWRISSSEGPMQDWYYRQREGELCWVEEE